MESSTATKRFAVVSPRSLLGVGFIVGLIARLSGLTTGSGLFRDDAWVAAPARTALGHAVDLTSTFPGFSIGLWPWLHLTAPSVLAAQVPALLAGLATLPALWWLFRRFDLAPWIAAVMAVSIYLSPVVITYSTRVKPYTTELVLAAIILGLSTKRSERFGWWLLAGVSVLSVTISFATAPVLVCSWVVVLMRERRSPKFVGHVLVPAASAGLLSLIVTVIFWRPVPPSLRAFWHPFFIDWSSPSAIARSIQHLVGGLSSGLTGAPLLTTTRFGPTAVALSVVIGLLTLGVCGFVAKRRTMVTPTLVVVLFVVLAGAHLVPLGTGRTDEVLYPALGLLLGSGLGVIITRSSGRLRRIVTVAVALSTGLVLIFGVTVHRAQYPVSDLDGALRAARSAGFPLAKVTVLDAPVRYNFAWSGFDAVSPKARVGLIQTSTNEAGYTVELAGGQPQLFVANADHGDATYHPAAWVREISRRVAAHQAISFLSLTEQVVNPTTGHLPGQAHDPHRSPFWKAFVRAGWKPGAFRVVRGVYVQQLIAPSRHD